ncbi:hypothetical protein BGZ80_005327 [Entomortierella chlamydospora]|uniref:Major facilitator superfamily (MFS) profile domain-containing protein n=1 Tax=Entomortierella chlamydospora TaxID=101097 RepID=A0A9P6MKP4_9FUNG|nr:hypothetical protein BGZ80_005327 [Entomortierella chlamydospora]
MDSREIKFPGYMVYTCGIAVLTSLSIGYVIGSPNVPEKAMRGIDGECGPDPYTKVNGFYNCFYYADLLWGFAIGSFCLGALAAGLTGGTIQNIYGRRKTMFLANIFFIVPRLLMVATIKSRGTLGACFQLLIVIGILISNALGLGLSTPPKWRVCMALLGVPALIQFALLPSMVESPKWLITQNRANEARQALQKLRGDANIDNEYSDMITMILKSGSSEPTPNVSDSKEEYSRDDSAYEDGIKVNNMGALDLSDYRPPKNYSVLYLFKSECCIIALQGILLHFFQQASGINGLIYYSTTFLDAVFGADKTKYLTVGTTAINLFSTILSVFFIDKVGRRTLLLISSGGCFISSVLLFSGGYAGIGDLVVAAVFLFIASFAIGLGPIPWLMMSELIPSYALSPASAIATSVNWLVNFIIGLIFPTIVKGLGNGTFILFGCFSGLCFLYVWIFLPETKGRRVEDIMAEKGVGPRSDI